MQLPLTWEVGNTEQSELSYTTTGKDCNITVVTVVDYKRKETTAEGTQNILNYRGPVYSGHCIKQAPAYGSQPNVCSAHSIITYIMSHTVVQCHRRI